tara:strand:- start:627 stop:776 length:150 start_codon:yes stop_codon:yes gene_type:complete
MNYYNIAEKIAQTWSVEKSREELKKELIQLLVLLPKNDLIDILKFEKRY